MVELPWMPSALRPNAASPGNWRKKSSAAAKYRADCLTLSKASKPAIEHGAYEMVIDFYPPDRRRRDLDNMLASFKQGIDAVCEAIGIDDYGLSFRLRRCEPVKGGKVVVSL
jgi:crossover junction endodeoxyribonuclease RusA